MNLDFTAILLIALGSALGFYFIMMMAPFRKTVLAFSWFIDVFVTYLLIQIFHASTAGMAIAMIGGITFSILRFVTCKVLKVKDCFQIIAEAFTKLKPKKK